MLPSKVRSSLGVLLSTVQCLSFQGIMLVPAPAVAQELGVDGTAGIAEAVDGGAHGLAGADASAVDGAVPNVGPVVAPNVGPAVAPVLFPLVVAPTREFMKVDQGSGGCEGGALRGEPNWPEMLKVGAVIPDPVDGPAFG